MWLEKLAPGAQWSDPCPQPQQGRSQKPVLELPEASPQDRA